MSAPQQPAAVPFCRRRKVIALTAAVGVLGALSVTTEAGQFVSTGLLARVGIWPLAVAFPEKVVVHRIRSIGYDTSPANLYGWISVERRELASDSPEVERLHALFSSGAFTGWPRELSMCGFNGDFAIEWVRGPFKRRAVFCFGCAEVESDSGIAAFRLREVGAFAASLFPNEEAFSRVADGYPPHGPKGAFGGSGAYEESVRQLRDRNAAKAQKIIDDMRERNEQAQKSMDELRLKTQQMGQQRVEPVSSEPTSSGPQSK